MFKLNLDQLSLCWLAGLLEGEGHFFPPSKAEPNRPGLSINMVDEDVIARVAAIFEVGYTLIPPKKAHWKPAYYINLRGRKAVDFMRVISPLMGERRRTQIERAIENYPQKPINKSEDSSLSKLTESQVREIKRRIAGGETAKQIAVDYDVTHYNIWAIRSGKTWRHVTEDRTSSTTAFPQDETFPLLVINTPENTLYWLAGVLEGEGSFMAGPPSSPNAPSISMAITDQDIMARVSQVFGVKYHIDGSKVGHYKTPYMIRVKSAPAFEWMKRLYPIMGQRRQAQIDRALEYYVYDPLRKVTEEQVKVIKRRLADGERITNVAKMLNIPYAIVKKIKLGRTWKHVTID